MTRIGIISLCLLSLPAQAADAGLSAQLPAMLKSVELRYNRIQSLQVSFNQSYKGQGPNRKPESGELFLRIPGGGAIVIVQDSSNLESRFAEKNLTLQLTLIVAAGTREAESFGKFEKARKEKSTSKN